MLPQHDVYVINTRKKATLGEKLGLQAAQMADSLIPAVMNKVADTLAKANSTLVQMRDTKF
ncbi:protease SohB domain protein [Acinetobacter baumannii 145660]|nr:protease SohB domain protein [Acinetobacter baumannii 1440750]EXE65495.1 protease SohB domain protein [Acinetobacter baumannii 1552865]EXG02308.1 protease SohB domain protein [Acinetobacter baumannii 1552389]EXG04681.1 protease SohB domain protein [Acinetobacter baumannii 1488685]EXG28268.1 protease SohB domain protein [Acinetobacter baumannii 323408]EXI31325.1 protease SohB domain protein [Acinetobacter baumannii 825610]EXQ95828.1 protease SohB domain protein [Acinetobacter baumannii 1112